MQSTNIPSKIPLPFGYAAGSSYINPIPAASQIGINDGRASLHDGFPPDTFTPVAAGGIPPFGGDFNGILNEITSITQWQEAGGFFVYDATFSTAVGGYPKGAILQSTSFDGLWTSSVENNTSNPDANGAGWTPTAFNNLKSIALSGSSVTLTQVQAAYPILIFTGTLTANCIVNIPAQVGKWIVVNRTTGSFTVQFKTPSGTGVYAPQGYAVYTYGDATNIYYVSSGFSTQEGYLTATQGQTVFPLTGFNYVPNTNNIAIFVNGSKQLSGVNFSETSSTAITFVSGLNVGDIVEFVIGASFGSPSIWASNVYYNEQGTGAVTRTLESKLQEFISVKDFGAIGDGIADDTVACQTAINYALANRINLLFPSGTYAVSTLLVADATYGMNIFSNGAILESNGTVANAVLEITNAVDFNIFGSMNIVVATLNVQYGIWIHALPVTANACSRISISNVIVRYAQIGIGCGSYNVDLAVSEIDFFGCGFFGCGTAIYNGGSQTVVSYNGCQIISEQGNPYVTFSVYRAIWQEGGVVTVTGGEIVGDFGDPSTGQFILMNPAQSSTYGNPYGIVRMSGVHTESLLQIVISNSRSLTTPTSNDSNLTMVATGGYISPALTDDFIFVQDSTYAGTIQVQNCNFYAQGTRTGYNISSASTAVKIQTDKTSFGYGFKNWMSGVFNGTLIHGVEPVLSAYGLGTQSIAAGSSAILLFTTTSTAGDLGRYNSRYPAGGGAFNVPAGGFSFLNINCFFIVNITFFFVSFIFFCILFILF